MRTELADLSQYTMRFDFAAMRALVPGVVAYAVGALFSLELNAAVAPDAACEPGCGSNSARVGEHLFYELDLSGQYMAASYDEAGDQVGWLFVTGIRHGNVSEESGASVEISVENDVIKAYSLSPDHTTTTDLPTKGTVIKVAYLSDLAPCEITLALEGAEKSLNANPEMNSKRLRQPLKAPTPLQKQVPDSIEKCPFLEHYELKLSAELRQVMWVDPPGIANINIAPTSLLFQPSTVLPHALIAAVNVLDSLHATESVESMADRLGLAKKRVPTYEFNFTQVGHPNQCPIRVCGGDLSHDPDWKDMSGKAVVFTGERYLNREKQIVDSDSLKADSTIKTGNGQWINFGCAGTVIGKLHLLGHTKAIKSRSYDSPPKRRRALFKAITADFTGTGLSYTVSGVPIHYWWDSGWHDERRFYMAPSASSVNLRHPSHLEAIWGENGALCIHSPRLQGVASMNLRKIKAATSTIKLCNEVHLNLHPDTIVTQLPVIFDQQYDISGSSGIMSAGTGTGTSKWKFIPTSNKPNFFHIKTMTGTQLLSVESAQITLATPGAPESQEWRIQPLPVGLGNTPEYQILDPSGKFALEDSGGSFELRQATWPVIPSQQFQFK